MKTGCVSIIITCYNYGHFLQECVESVLNQTYSNWEAIIVDDGSTDNTPLVAEELVTRAPEKISYLRLENGGVSRARNIGLEKTSGEYILPLDADDMLFPWALDELVRCIKMDPAYGFAYGALEVLDGLPGEASHWFPGPYSRDLFQVENLASVTNLWKRELYDQGVHFRDGFFFEDWDIWLQIIERGGVGGYTPKPIFQCRTHLDGRTSFARYFYFQGLAQQAQANSKVFYQEEYRDFTETLLYNAPQSFDKTTAIFLVPYTGKEGQEGNINEEELNAALFPLLEAYVESGHLACIFGNYVKDEDVPKGVYVLDFADMWDFEKVDPFFGTFGANLTLFNYGWDAKLLKHILRKPTVNLLVEMKENGGMPADYYYSHKPGALCLEKKREGSNHKEYLFSDSEQLVSFLSKAADTEYQGRRESLTVERKRKLVLSKQKTYSNTYRCPSEENDISIIIPSRNIDSARLRRCLSSIRLNTFNPEVPVIVSDFGSHPTYLEGIKEVCQEYGAHLEISNTRAPWSRSRVLNIGARKADTHWLLFTDADMIFSEDLLSIWDEYRRTFGDDSLFLAQCKKLQPLANLPDIWSASLYEQYEQHGRLFESFGHGGFQAIRRDRFEALRGFNEQYSIWGGEDNDLSCRAEQMDMRLCWLHPGKLLHQWHIKDIDENAVRKNREDFQKIQGNLNYETNDPLTWGRLTEKEQAEFSQCGTLAPPERTGASARITEELLRPERTEAEKIHLLLTWGDICLQQEKYESALETFEDIYSLDPENINADMGLACCYFFRGAPQRAAHNAYKVLGKNPNHEQAKELLRKIQEGLNGYYAYIQEDKAPEPFLNTPLSISN